MDIVTSKQCEKCLTWKQPYFTQATEEFGTAPKWAVIWFCPEQLCHEYSTPPESQNGVLQ